MKNILIATGIIFAIGLVLIFVMPMLTQDSSTRFGVEQFKSEQDFRTYFSSGHYYRGFGAVGMAATAPLAESSAKDSVSYTPERVSETNVQVQGIDEPDIVKTDGNNIYFRSGSEIVKILAFPPENMKKLDTLSETGNLFLMDGQLMVLSYNKISAYDSTDFSEIWTLNFNGSLVNARLYGNKIYLVTNLYVNNETQFPIPLAEGKEIMWGDIYHPVVDIGSDTIFNVLKINSDGIVTNTVSFAGRSWDTDLYMSVNNIYVSYVVQKTELDIMVEILKDSSDILPNSLISEVDTIYKSDMELWNKYYEITKTVDNYMRTLDRDKSLMLNNELNNRAENYLKNNLKELEKTGIVKIDLNLDLQAAGMVPGRILNQWAMDEHKNNFRIATTIGGWSSSENDLYILDKNMDIMSEVTGFGLTERIYSVRFMGDVAYVVTFRETDPFYVMDLSNPKDPKIVGELKIPGYSSYLHPLSDELILGIGKEGSNVKISLFNVADPSNPTEDDKYFLEEWWSDVLNTHHAFLLDTKHEVFFIPGSKGGYIFSYDNNNLKMEKAVATSQVRRAIYINDFMYVISDGAIIALDETTWERVGEVEWKVEYGYNPYIRPGVMVG